MFNLKWVSFIFLQAFAAQFVGLGVSVAVDLPGFIPEFDVQTSSVRWGCDLSFPITLCSRTVSGTERRKSSRYF